MVETPRRGLIPPNVIPPPLTPTFPGYSYSPPSTGGTTPQPPVTTITPVVVTTTGTVTSGQATYFGSAVVPGTGGKTAGQLSRDISKTAALSPLFFPGPTTPETYTKYQYGVDFITTQIPAQQIRTTGTAGEMIAGMKQGSFAEFKAKSESMNIPSISARPVLSFEEKVARKTTYPLGEFIYQKTGLTIEKMGEIQKISPTFGSLIGIGPFGFKSKEIGEFKSSVMKGFLTEFKEKPVTQAAIAGLSFGISAALPFAGAGAVYGGAKIGSLFGTKAAISGGMIGAQVFKGVTVGIGAGLTGVYAKNIGRQVYSAKTPSEAGIILGREAATFTSIGLGSYAGIKASRIAGGIITTRGLTKVKYEDIVAEERLKYEKGIIGGQKYPQIRKGETAGQLLGEFKPLLPGEIKAGQFTASPTGFAKQTYIQKGSSELPGLYGSPKLNPQFFGGVEPGLFGFNIPTGFPTAIRSTPEGGFQLIKGLSASQASLVPKSMALNFLSTAAKPGVSYVTFMKTEKEAVSMAGTFATQTQLKYYSKTPGLFGFKFAIPEYSLKTTGGIGISAPSTSKIASTISSSGNLGSYVYNPVSFSIGLSSSLKGISKYSYPSIPSSGISISTSYSYKPSTSYSIRSISRLSSISSSRPSGYSISSIPSISSSRISIASIPSYPSYAISKPSYPSYPSYPSTTTYMGFPKFSFPKTILSFKIGKQPLKYTPSLGALTFNIKAPKISRISMTGISRRPIIGFRKKRRKK